MEIISLVHFPQRSGNMKNLQVLYLSRNQFEGEIPNSLENLTKLRRLYLGFNNLSGDLPNSIFNIPTLEIMYLNNNFNGGLPNKKSDKLIIIDISSNNLQGKIPQWNDVSMNLVNNQFSAQDIEKIQPQGLECLQKTSKCSAGKDLSRKSTTTLKYYGLGLKTGNYNVDLMFANIDNDDTYAFDIYIQGLLKIKNFQIGVMNNKASILSYTIPVTENTKMIEISLIPKFNSKVLISAINVTPDFKVATSKEEGGMKRSTKIGILVGLSIFIVILCVIGYRLWARKSSTNY
ncbi:hypothetical protein ZOSMA_2G00020 [Zostera marina]|uniref:non-specific serine/threonine protein kinase n=1 Tax=Zostera marina TaxID=29655 RepID=A0A0K9PCQ2_ZOSMR|nr:hypothetical protein ZOSMA_2G00020 [Zostera marina]